jgi:sulfite dehydrogenase (quinone) subunit SoeC
VNPAFSVVFLTTASGAGYGMLLWLGVLDALGVLPRNSWFGVVAILLGLALSAAGLAASTFHLGHPERAWRAISQWRSSWLSREGVLALFIHLPALGFAIAWWFAGPMHGVTVAFGLITALCAMATVVCQAMIYATLKPVRQWHNWLVLPNFLLLSLFSGAVWLVLLRAGIFVAAIAIALTVIAGISKLAYWQHIKATASDATIESATGLGSFGTVRALEAPHTEENYLLREMGYEIARKHSVKLRRIGFFLAFIAPLVLIAAGIALGGTTDTALLCLAVLAMSLGIYTERWLFFAEATHTVTLYYGRRPTTA